LIKVLRDGAWANVVISAAILVVCGEHELIALCLFLTFATLYVARRIQGENLQRLCCSPPSRAWSGDYDIGAGQLRAPPRRLSRSRRRRSPRRIRAATLVRHVVLNPAVILAAFLWIQFVSGRQHNPRRRPIYSRLVALVTVMIALVLTIPPSLALNEHLVRSITLALSFVLLGGTLYLFLLRSHLARLTSPRLKAAAGIALASRYRCHRIPAAHISRCTSTARFGGRK